MLYGSCKAQVQECNNFRSFFFEEDKLVLNTGIPYPIAIDDIEHVELNYNTWELEHTLQYTLFIRVIKKNGKTKKVFYKGSRTAKPTPSDMAAALEEKGIRCVVVNK